MKKLAALVAQALGVSRHTTKTWFSLCNNKSRSYIEKWVPLATYMTWKDTVGHFSPDWTSQWDIGEEKLIPDNHLSPYEKHIMGGRHIVLSKFKADMSTSGRN